MTRPEHTAALGAVDRLSEIRRVLWVVLFLNVTVAIAKLAWGYYSGSIAMQADGFHSFFDGASNVVGLIGIHLASRPADKDHPYGHSKFETYASAAIGAMLVFAAYNIGSSAVSELMHGARAPQVDAVSFVVMIGTLAVNITITLWERRVGRRLNSEILLADASHTGSDVWVSLGVIAGLVAVRAGYPAADPIIALFVAVVIAYTAWQVFRQAGATLSDASRIPSDRIANVCEGVEGVLGCHHVRTRGLKSEVYVDMHILVEATLSVEAGHAIADAVETSVCETFSTVADVVVHVEPFNDQQLAKGEAEEGAGLV